MKRVRALLVLVVALLVGVLGCSKFKANRELRKIEKEIPNAATTEELEELDIRLDSIVSGVENWKSDKDEKQYEDVQLSLDQAYFDVWNTELSKELTNVEKETANVSSFKEAHKLYSILDSISNPMRYIQPAPTRHQLRENVCANEENETRIQEIKHRIVDQARVYQREAPIVITSIYPSRPNFAGGVDVHITFINKSDRTFKYVYFEVSPYNAVGDRVSSEIGDKCFTFLKSTGPYKPGYGSKSGYYWGNVWYNHSIRSIKLNTVEIDYMDGTHEEFVGKWVDLLLKK
ncbi:MAG: hypothetical protein E3J71_04790 [Candidatus Stahlbacteria bacterium]|nr:MAG: hypothetical protein E3J71_04790 [Candidatus Stahlbacteria bacterium]